MVIPLYLKTIDIYNGMFHTPSMSKTQKQKNGSKEPTTPRIQGRNADYTVYIDRASYGTHSISIYIDGHYAGMWAGLPREVRV